MSPRMIIPSLAAASFVGASVALVAPSVGLSAGKSPSHLWTYSDTVLEVADGDSFTLANGVRVRLIGVDAPETGRCESNEAKAYVENMLEGKSVIVQRVLEDDYGRYLSYVYLDREFINDQVVRLGFARTTSNESLYRSRLSQSQVEAQKAKRGIWSDRCRSNIPSGTCDIKANIRGKDSFYYLPSCPYYAQVLVDTSYGDGWFCSESEASKAGFLKSPHCP